MRILKTLAAVAVVLVLAPFGVASAAASVTYKVMTWNVAGWTLHRGSATNGMATAVANAARDGGVDLFALNELCFDQLHCALPANRPQVKFCTTHINAQPNYGRMDRWYSPTLNHANNTNNRGRYRELDDTDSRCPGYGETTSPPGNTEGACGLGKKLDLIFVRDNRYTGAYDADSVAIPNSCGGPCSDHRLVRGTVTVTTS